MQRNTGYFPTESLEPCGNRLFSRSALNEGYLFRGSLDMYSAGCENIRAALRLLSRFPVLTRLAKWIFPTKR